MVPGKCWQGKTFTKSEETRVLELALILGKLLSFCEPQFPYWEKWTRCFSIPSDIHALLWFSFKHSLIMIIVFLQPAPSPKMIGNLSLRSNSVTLKNFLTTYGSSISKITWIHSNSSGLPNFIGLTTSKINQVYHDISQTTAAHQWLPILIFFKIIILYSSKLIEIS